MLFRFIKFFLSLILIGIIAVTISETEGRTKINWLGWGIDLKTSYFVIILAFFSLILIFLDRIWLMIINIPKSAIIRRDKKNREKVEKSLIRAFLLASHGEFKQAAQEAKMISNNTYDKKFGKILIDHAYAVENSRNNKSNKTTKKYLMSLTNEKNTSFIGYLALMKNEIDQEKIYEYANEAHKLDPSSDQVLKALFFSSIKLNKYLEAIRIGTNPLLKKAIDKEMVDRVLSDLYYLLGVEYLKTDKKNSERKFKSSLDLNPGNIESCLNLVKIMRGISAKSRSLKLLKNTFFHSPHYNILLELIEKMNFSNSGEKVSFAKKLIKNKHLSKENEVYTKILVSKFASQNDIWGDAKNILSKIKQNEMTKEGFEVLAEIASSANNNEDVKKYLKEASNSKVGFGYFCKSCGFENLNWELICPTCLEISTISWGCNKNVVKSNKSLGLKLIT